jgi:hypothetical protein
MKHPNANDFTLDRVRTNPSTEEIWLSQAVFFDFGIRRLLGPLSRSLERGYVCF